MTNRFKYIILLSAVISLLASCKKYLQVQPEDKYTEQQVFSSEAAVQDALNGLYINLGNNSLYGGNLTTTTLELMGQRYNVVASSDNSYQPLQVYGYTQTNVQTIFEDIWQKAYANILAANKFITAIDGAVQGHIITAPHAQLLKGEAIAMRALLHFDLLRIFGPVYSMAAAQPAIPYYTGANGAVQPILTASQILDSVLTDFSLAESLLSADPVISQGVVAGQDFYNSNRSQRLNYFAVKGLQARACLYGGQTSAAHDSAKSVLVQGEKWFPWMNYSYIVSDQVNPDRIFYPEVLFSVYNQDMYTDYTTYFNPTLIDQDILAANVTRLTNTFESNTNDYRYTTTWLNSAKAYRTFYKYADVADPTKPWRFLQPMIRKTELYYILAETETDMPTAFGYIDSARYNRGLPVLANTAVLATEIKKEYQKEFFGEGQIFFYYKRLNMASIPSALNGTGSVTPNYVVPLPLSETTPR